MWPGRCLAAIRIQQMGTTMNGEVLDRAKDEDKMNKQGGTTTSGAGQILAQIKDEEID
jgi:hypothetical protein